LLRNIVAASGGLKNNHCYLVFGLLQNIKKNVKKNLNTVAQVNVIATPALSRS
jgi:hypothetical protein